MRSLWRPLRSETRSAVGASGLLLGAGLVAGASNLVFNLIVARGGGAANYGAVGSLLMVATVAGFFATGCQYAVAQLAAVGSLGTGRMLRPAFWVVAPWLTLSLGVLVLAAPFSAYLHLASVGPVLLTSVLLGVILLGAAPSGLLVGASRFRALATIGIVSTLVRLIMGVWIGHGPGTVVGALVASLVSVGVSAVLSIAVLMLSRRIGRLPRPAAGATTESTKGEARLMTRGALGALIAAALWAIWTLPVLAARHQLSLDQAGAFAAAQLLAGGIIYLTTPLVTAFYPTLARGGDRQAVVVGFVATVVIALVGVLGLGLLGPTLMPRVYGPEFHPGMALLFSLGISAAVTTVVGFACWSAVARRQLRVPVVSGLAVGLICAVALCSVAAHSGVQLGAVPAAAMMIGGCAAGVTQLAISRRSVRSLDAVHAGEIAGL